MIPESGSSLDNKPALERFFQALSRNKKNLSTLNHNPVRRFMNGYFTFQENKLIEDALSSAPTWFEPLNLNQIAA